MISACNNRQQTECKHVLLKSLSQPRSVLHVTCVTLSQWQFLETCSDQTLQIVTRQTPNLQFYLLTTKILQRHEMKMMINVLILIIIYLFSVFTYIHVDRQCCFYGWNEQNNSINLGWTNLCSLQVDQFWKCSCSKIDDPQNLSNWKRLIFRLFEAATQLGIEGRSDQMVLISDKCSISSTQKLNKNITLSRENVAVTVWG